MADVDPTDDVVVNVGFDVDTADLVKLRAAIQSMCGVMDKWSHCMDSSDKVQKKLKNNVSDFDKKLAAHTKNFGKHLNVLRMFTNYTKSYVVGSFMMLAKAAKPAAMGLAAIGAGFVAAKAAALTGVAAIKLWNMAINSIPAAVAGVLGVLSVFTAAITEVQAAAIAPFAGQSASSMNRFYQSLFGDPRIAALGSQSLTSTANALIQAKVPLSEIRNTIKELGDYAFYAGGGDAAKGLEGITQGLVELSKSKTLSSGGLKQFSQQFGAMAEDVEKAGKAFVGKDVTKFIEFLTSDPESLKKFSDGLDVSNNTLIGMFKQIKTLAMGALLPFGNQIMDLLKGPLGGFRETLLEFINRVMPRVVDFFGQVLPIAFNKLGGALNWLDEKMQSVLPVFVENFGKGLQTIGNLVGYVVDIVRQITPIVLKISEGFDILWNSILKPLITGVGSLFFGLLSEITDFLKKNEETLSVVGKTIGSWFRPDGPIIQTLRNAWGAITVIIDALAPALLKIAELLKSPIYLFEIIKDNKDNIDALGAGIESFVDEALAPFVGLVVDTFTWLVGQGPEIGKILAQVGALLNPIIELGRALLGALDHLGGIKTIIAFLISAKVIGGLRSLSGAMATMLSARRGVESAVLGAGPGAVAGRTAATAGMFAGTALASYGMMNGGTRPGALATVGGFALTGAGIGAMMGGGVFSAPGAAIGGAIGAGIGGIAAAYNYRSNQRADLRRQFESQREMARANAQSWWDQKLSTSSRVTGSFAQLQALREDTRKAADLASNPASANQALVAMSRTLGNDFVLMQENVDIFREEHGVNLRAGATIQEAMGAITGQLDYLTDTLESGREIITAVTGNVETLSSVFGITGDSAEETERMVLDFADSIGFDMTQALESSTVAISALDAALQTLPSRANIVSSAFQSIYDTTELLTFEQDVKSAGEVLSEALSSLDVTGSTPEEVGAKVDEIIRSQLEFIPREIERRLASGELTPEEATAETERLLGEVLGVFDPSTALGAEAITKIESYGAEIFDAISVSETELQTQADLINGWIISIGGQFRVMYGEVINGLATRTQSFLAGFGLGSNFNYDEAGQIVPSGDSASPASNLMNTMGGHYAIDSMLSGKRVITSGWRNWNLGSSNSDHVTGRALDVVGDNLGSYASLMKAAGGFAEFHGTGANRHLHVVPPIGDTPVPRAPVPAHARQNNGPVQTNNNNITVNPSQGMNETALAMRVAREIQRINQDAMERL